LGARIEAGFLNARDLYVAVLTFKKFAELKIGFPLRRPPTPGVVGSEEAN
jgi:hypothetical protein